MDGITGDVLHDSAGQEDALRVDLRRVDHAAPYGFSFRLPQGVQQPIYLRIRLASPLQAGYSLFLDEIGITQATELYSGGPWVGAFAGIRRGILGDAWAITVGNDRRGRLQEWFQRFFDLESLGLLLPTSGQNRIPESIIPGNQNPER